MELGRVAIGFEAWVERGRLQEALETIVSERSVVLSSGSEVLGRTVPGRRDYGKRWVRRRELHCCQKKYLLRFLENGRDAQERGQHHIDP